MILTVYISLQRVDDTRSNSAFSALPFIYLTTGKESNLNLNFNLNINHNLDS